MHLEFKSKLVSISFLIETNQNKRNHRRQIEGNVTQSFIAQKVYLSKYQFKLKVKTLLFISLYDFI